MNKKIVLDKNIVILFFFNVLIFLSTIIFKFYFTKMNYYSALVKGIFVLDIIILFVVVVFNVLLLFEKKYDIKKIIILIFLIYIFLNSIFINLMNNRYNYKYYKVSKNLLSYCKSYNCHKYETINLVNKKDFIIYKTYYDYNNLKNKIEIHTIYDISKVVNIKAKIYSNNELFSEQLIYDELNAYFLNFGIYINSENIRKAFINRDKSNVKENNIHYKVNSIYLDDSLDKFETIISADL